MIHGTILLSFLPRALMMEDWDVYFKLNVFFLLGVAFSLVMKTPAPHH